MNALVRVRRSIPVAIAAMTLVAACGSSDRSAAEPADVLAAYVDAVNAADIDDVMSVFSDDVVVVRHPMSRLEPLDGSSEVRPVEMAQLDRAVDEGAYQVVVTESVGPTVVFDHIFNTVGGTCFTATGHMVTVEDGRITHWEWPENFGLCA